MTGRDESLIMCDRCKRGFPGREIANFGSLERPEWVCADCFRAWIEPAQMATERYPWQDIERTDHPTMPSIGDDEGWP